MILGTGATGTVNLGENAKTKEKIAVKAISMKKIQSYGIEEEISREVENLTAALELNNPFFIKLIENFFTSNNYYILTEYCDGGTLAEDIQKRNAVYTKTEVLEIAYQMILGLSSLAIKEIVHRDLKPENIFLKGGLYKIGDFGSSKVVPQKFTTASVGTESNFAPEFYDMNKQKTCKVDVWALGCILHKLLYGTEFFKAKDIMTFQKNVREMKYVPGDKTSGGEKVDDNTKKLLCGMFEKDPSARLSVDEMRKHPAFDKSLVAKFSKQLDSSLQKKWYG